MDKYIKLLFCGETVPLFIGTGLFVLVRDVPILKKKKLIKESNIAKVLGYTYIFGSIVGFIAVRVLI